MKDWTAGQVLGRYELLLPVAKGGMAQVWAARLRGTRGFQKIVAVKTILAGAMDDERMERMFLEEATLAAQIHHPNVVGTLELGEHEGTLYLVMEWVDGEALNFVMNRAAGRGGIPLPIAVNLVGQACKGLHAAHDLRDESGALLGVVHRDISAQNVLVTYSGNAKLVDFGIAKVTARASGLTEAGEIKGKFAYLAPEQALAQPIDRRTDIFGMGILLYFLTTGRHPFKGTSPGETLHKIISGKLKPPSAIVGDYPPELEAVVCKALNKSPDERWATANDMLSALERAMPQCLEGSFEVKVADFMSQLLGHRLRERRAELRLAQQMLDGSGVLGVSLEGMSSGSLRAISVETDGAKSDDRAEPTNPEPAAAPIALVARKKKKRTYATAATLAVAALVAGWSLRAKRPASVAETRAPSPVPAAAPPPVAEPPPTVDAVRAPPVAPSATPAADNQDSAAKRAKKPAAASPPRASASPPTASPPPAAPQEDRSPAKPAPNEERPASKPAAERARDAAPSAWDPGSFGGRR